MSETTTATPTSVIHDIGYQRYDGMRLGRLYVFGSLFAHGLRTAFGLGRSFKAKIFPWLVTGVVCVIAVVLMAVRAVADLPDRLTVGLERLLWP